MDAETSGKTSVQANTAPQTSTSRVPPRTARTNLSTTNGSPANKTTP